MYIFLKAGLLQLICAIASVKLDKTFGHECNILNKLPNYDSIRQTSFWIKTWF